MTPQELKYHLERVHGVDCDAVLVADGREITLEEAPCDRSRRVDRRPAHPLALREATK
jgi:hypothetical protein